MMLTHEQSPNPGQVPPEWKNAILHARVNRGDTELLATGIPQCSTHAQRLSHADVDSIEESERIYAALIDGGEIFMPMAQTPFADLFAQVRDRFGMNCMLLYERPHPW